MTGPLSRQAEGQAPSDLVAPGQPVRALVRLGRLIASPPLSPAAQALLALAAYLAVWTTTRALPLVQDPARAQLDQTSMDPNFYTWSLRWWPYAIMHGLNPLFTSQLGAPAGHVLAWVTTIPPLALISSPLTAAAGPVAAFNVLTAIALPVSGWMAFVLCRRITRRFWPALFGGAVYGFSAYEMNHAAAGQLNLTFSLLLPLMAYLVVLWRDGALGPRAFTGLLTAALALQFYLFLETFADLTAIWAAALLAGYALAGRAGRPQVARLSRRVGLAYLCALALAAPYLWYALAHMPANFEHASGLDLASLVLPRPGHTLRLSWLAHIARLPTPTSAEGYLGIPLLLMALILAVTSWSSKITRFLCVMLVIVVLAALGPFLYLDGHRIIELPWARLWFLPIARSAFPPRFMVFAFLALAVMSALLLAGLPGRTRVRWPGLVRWLRLPLGALAIAAFVLDTPTLQVTSHSTLPKFITAGEYRRLLTPGETVAVVSANGNAGLLWQADAGFYFRLAGGYINAALTPRSALPAPIQALSHSTPPRIGQFRAYLRTARVGAILVDIKAEPKWLGVLRKLGFSATAIYGVVVYRTGD